MRIVYFGSSEFGLPSLEAIRRSRHHIEHIFTQPAQPAGRGLKARPTPVAAWASANHLPCTETADINSADVVETITGIRPDLLVVIAFARRLPRHVLDLFPRGAITCMRRCCRNTAALRRSTAPSWTARPKPGCSIITVADRMDAGMYSRRPQCPSTRR